MRTVTQTSTIRPQAATTQDTSAITVGVVLLLDNGETAILKISLLLLTATWMVRRSNVWTAFRTGQAGSAGVGGSTGSGTAVHARSGQAVL